MPSYTVIFTIKEERRIDIEAESLDAAKELVEEESILVLRNKGDLDNDEVVVEDAWEND